MRTTTMNIRVQKNRILRLHRQLPITNNQYSRKPRSQPSWLQQTVCILRISQSTYDAAGGCPFKHPKHSSISREPVPSWDSRCVSFEGMLSGVLRELSSVRKLATKCHSGLARPLLGLASWAFSCPQWTASSPRIPRSKFQWTGDHLYTLKDQWCLGRF